MLGRGVKGPHSSFLPLPVPQFSTHDLVLLCPNQTVDYEVHRPHLIPGHRVPRIVTEQGIIVDFFGLHSVGSLRALLGVFNLRVLCNEGILKLNTT